MNTNPGPVSQKKLSKQRGQRPNILRLTFRSHFRYALILNMCHISEHCEYYKTSEETSKKVYRTSNDGIPIAVIIELVVTGQGKERAEPWTQRKEYLRRRVYPHLKYQVYNNCMLKHYIIDKVIHYI